MDHPFYIPDLWPRLFIDFATIGRMRQVSRAFASLAFDYSAASVEVYGGMDLSGEVKIVVENHKYCGKFCARQLTLGLKPKCGRQVMAVFWLGAGKITGIFPQHRIARDTGSFACTSLCAAAVPHIHAECEADCAKISQKKRLYLVYVEDRQYASNVPGNIIGTLFARFLPALDIQYH